MRVKFTTPLVLVTLATLPACVTSRPHGTAQTSTAKAIAANRTKPLAKEGQKTQDAADVAASAVTAAPTPDTVPVATDLTRTFNRLSDPTMQLMDEDIRAATALHPAPKGSMEEAVLILAQLRLLKIQTEQSSKFQSRDLYEQGEGNQQAAAPNSNLPSMEKQFRDLDIDLVTSFNQNTHLKTLPTLGLVKTLLEQTSNSPTFQSGMQTIIDQEAQKWAALQKTAKPEDAQPPTPDTAAPAPVDATAAAPAAPEPSLSTAPGDGHTGPADLKRSDAILMQSQKLADKGEFKQAIDFAARIDTRDPFFDQAKEKIKIYSNRAVQDLRQKAAQAFQNAMPVADNRAKAAYLKQAKELLEQALKDYPVADQLDTVRDNLSVITRDLSGIDQETAGANTPKTQ